MKNKEYYFNIWTRWVWGYNDVYEAPLENYPLQDDTEDSLDMLESYCRLIMTEGKRRKKYNKENSYELFSPSIQDAIQQVINIMCDGRELHDVVDVNNPNLPIKKFDHHLDKNGKLPFENDPFCTCQLIVNDIPAVKEIIKSVKETVNFEQFYNGMWYYFEGYESGSVAIKFTKINKTAKGEYTFDGDVIFFETIEGRCYGNGIILNSGVTDMSFDRVPYCLMEYWDDEEDTIENQLINFIRVDHECIDGKIEYRKKMTDEKMRKYVIEHMSSLLSQTFDI